MAIVNHLVQSQATILAYIDVFVALGVIAMLMVPLALTLRSVNRSAGAKPAHCCKASPDLSDAYFPRTSEKASSRKSICPISRRIWP